MAVICRSRKRTIMPGYASVLTHFRNTHKSIALTVGTEGAGKLCERRYFKNTETLSVRHNFEPVHSRWYLPGLYILPEWNHLENTIPNSALCHSSRTFHLHQPHCAILPIALLHGVEGLPPPLSPSS